MKAIHYEQYGAPIQLQLKEVETPTPKKNEVLIKVRAASVNSWDWDLLHGTFINRLIFGGFTNPKLKILGCDVAGTIEAIGENVAQFRVGDQVFGDISQFGWGGFAEYVCAHQKAFTHKGSKLSFEEAAAIPQAGVMALQSILDKGQVTAGQKVLINGAGGGVGTFAIQLAKLYGAEVTGVDNDIKLDLMHSIGADYVIDYKKADFTKAGKRYDLIIDVVANRSINEYKRTLAIGGRFVMVGGTPRSLLQAAFIGPLISLAATKKLGILAHEPNKDLASLKELVESSKIKVVIDKCYPLHETADALKHLGEGRTKGKVVITTT